MTDTISVSSPYDGSEIGVVPANTADDVDEAVRSAKRALAAGPLPPWRRAEILETAAHQSLYRVDRPVRISDQHPASFITDDNAPVLRDRNDAGNQQVTIGARDDLRTG